MKRFISTKVGQVFFFFLIKTENNDKKQQHFA